MRSLDEIYGIGIHGYAKAQNKTIEDIINMIEVDIMLLQDNYNRYAVRNLHLSEYDLETVREIKNLIEKKRTHLKRLKEFASN